MSMFSTTLRTLSLLALPLLVSTSGAGAVSLSAGAVAPAVSPAVSATLEQCVTAADQSGRSTTFSGQMETIPGAHRMAVQIVVQERAATEVAFRTLGAAGLDAWQRSEAGLKIYKDVRQVTDLPAPASFRAIVHFRWLDEKGEVIKRATRRTPECRQPAPPSPPPTALAVAPSGVY
jgi:hypothetical protein